jgi:hypothetical protein
MRAFVMKLLQKDDIHMAVLCLLSIGDKNDAVEVYVSHKRYLYVRLVAFIPFTANCRLAGRPSF